MMDGVKFHEMEEELYLRRDPKGIKSDFGRVLLIGSSLCYPLAILIAEKAATKVGNGYVALAVTKDVFPIAAQRCSLTTIFEQIENRDDSFLAKDDLGLMVNKYDAILFGNGVSETKANYEFLRRLIQVYQHRLILDATALSLLAKYGAEILDEKCVGSTILLTPHLGEANRLFKTERKSRNPADYLEDAISFNRKHHTMILLKSYQSYLVDEEEGILSDTSSSPSLAKAGSGDGLAGYLAGVLAYPFACNIKDGILFADHMVHLAANKAEHELTVGGSNILSALDKIPC
jgi:hydroxyethylthiazole kinase-like uncharacterized protein yjeF